MKNETKGMAIALAAAVISGLAIFYSKISLVKIDPLILTTSRNLIAGLLFVSVFLMTRRFGELRSLSRRDLAKLLVIGLVGGSIPFYLFFNGLQEVGAQSANLIHKSLFVWVGLLSVIFLKEKIGLASITAFILVFFGNYYFAGTGIKLGQGELMIFAATLLWSAESIIAKKVLSNVSSELVGLFRMGLGSLVLLAAVFLSGKSSSYLAMGVKELTFITVGGTILFGYVYFWFKALKYAPANIVTLVLTFSVVVGNILNGSFAGVKLLPKDIYGSSIIFMAVFIVLAVDLLRNRGKAWKQQEAS